MLEKVTNWILELDRLAKSAAFAALTHGLVGRWLYVIRVTEPSTELFQPLETAIRQKIFPALTGQPPPNDHIRKLLALPPRLGGLGITNIADTVSTQQEISKAISEPLVNLIVQETNRCEDVNTCQHGDILQATLEQRLIKHATTEAPGRAISQG